MTRSFFFLAALSTLGILSALAIEIPEIVGRFQESKDLWNAAHVGRYLPGYHFYPIDDVVSAAWQRYVRTHGKAIIDNE